MDIKLHWGSWQYVWVLGVGNNQTKCQKNGSNDSFVGLRASCIISTTCFFAKYSLYMVLDK